MSVQAKTGMAGVLLAFVSFIQPAPGEMTYLSQSRTVGGVGWDIFSIPTPPFWGWTPIAGKTEAPDFGPFVEAWWHGAKATQDSVLGATEIAALGTATGSNLFWKNSKLAEGTSYSNFAVSFTVDEPTAFSLTGTLKMAENLGTGGTSSFSMTGPGLALLYQTVEPKPNGSKLLVEFSEQGLLLPGTYSIVAATDGKTGDLWDKSNSFAFNLAIPAPGGGAAIGLALLGFGGLGRRPRGM